MGRAAPIEVDLKGTKAGLGVDEARKRQAAEVEELREDQGAPPAGGSVSRPCILPRVNLCAAVPWMRLEDRKESLPQTDQGLLGRLAAAKRVKEQQQDRVRASYLRSHAAAGRKAEPSGRPSWTYSLKRTSQCAGVLPGAHSSEIHCSVCRAAHKRCPEGESPH